MYITENNVHPSSNAIDGYVQIDMQTNCGTSMRMLYGLAQESILVYTVFPVEFLLLILVEIVEARVVEIACSMKLD